MELSNESRLLLVANNFKTFEALKSHFYSPASDHYPDDEKNNYFEFRVGSQEETDALEIAMQKELDLCQTTGNLSLAISYYFDTNF